MSAFRAIVAAVDFSETSQDALRLACDLARDHGSRLRLVHVVTDPWQQPWVVEVPGTAFEELRRQAVEAADEQLRKLQVHHADRVPEATSRVLIGSPPFEIARHAEEQGADLIVIGTHGYGPVRRLLLGSTADRVVRQASCPVLTVPHRSLRTPGPREHEVKAIAGPAEG